MEEVKEWFHSIPPGSTVNSIKDARDEKNKIFRVTIVRKDMTALHYAAFFCEYKIVQFLLENGAGECVVLIPFISYNDISSLLFALLDMVHLT